jgi:hypothetical protein
VEQLSPDDVAELLGIEAGHARVLVHRAALGLRTFLGPLYGNEPIAEESP